MKTLGREVSVMRETCSMGFTLTAAIHSARSWGAKLLHSRRTEGLEQLVCAVAGCPSRVAATTASLAK
jgi:hypothetical protein